MFMLSDAENSGAHLQVCDKLSVALSQMGHRVMTVSPSYRQVTENREREEGKGGGKEA